MARKRLSPDEEIQRLEREREQLQNRMNRAKARKLDELQAENRKAENRIKILIGIAVQQAVKAGELDQQQVDQWLDRHITPENDRAFIAEQRERVRYKKFCGEHKLDSSTNDAKQQYEESLKPSSNTKTTEGHDEHEQQKAQPPAQVPPHGFSDI